jgi:2-polyprenyl-6-methoxyphenol hydroxylase-like FAD-dependent oxidoreductase
MKNILISGAGIAGLCLARQLKKHGIAYTLIEKKLNLEIS